MSASFVLSKLLWALVEPGNALVLLLAIGVAMQFTSRYARWGRAVVAAVSFVLLVIAVSPVPALLALPLEERFERLETLPDRVDGIITLGGAVIPTLAHDRGEPSVNDAAERILTFAELVRRYPNAKHVFTGGSGLIQAQDLPEDAVMRGALRQAGIDPDDVVYENESRNTWENALYSQRLLQPKPGETWLLVTSAMHMPRSVGIFRRIGWPVVAYPVDYRTRHGARPYLRLEFDRQVILLDEAVREWIGLAAYRLMDRTDALLPEP